jgi:hypothetical protein
MRAVLKAAYKRGMIESRGLPRFWVTEFSWDSAPPDPDGLPLRLHARWTAEALYRIWRSGVSLVTWLQLRDQPWVSPRSTCRAGSTSAGRPFSRTAPSRLRGRSASRSSPTSGARATVFGAGRRPARWRRSRSSSESRASGAESGPAQPTSTGSSNGRLPPALATARSAPESCPTETSRLASRPIARVPIRLVRNRALVASAEDARTRFRMSWMFASARAAHDRARWRASSMTQARGQCRARHPRNSSAHEPGPSRLGASRLPQTAGPLLSGLGLPRVRCP